MNTINYLNYTIYIFYLTAFLMQSCDFSDNDTSAKKNIGKIQMLEPVNNTKVDMYCDDVKLLWSKIEQNGHDENELKIDVFLEEKESNNLSRFELNFSSTEFDINKLLTTNKQYSWFFNVYNKNENKKVLGSNTYSFSSFIDNINNYIQVIKKPSDSTLNNPVEFKWNTKNCYNPNLYYYIYLDTINPPIKKYDVTNTNHQVFNIFYRNRTYYWSFEIVEKNKNMLIKTSSSEFYADTNQIYLPPTITQPKNNEITSSNNITWQEAGYRNIDDIMYKVWLSNSSPIDNDFTVIAITKNNYLEVENLEVGNSYYIKIEAFSNEFNQYLESKVIRFTYN